MIPARPNRFLRWCFGHDVEARLRRTFGAVRVRGLTELRRSCAAGPVLVVSNHTSFWDPMFCIWLSTRLAPFDGYAMMDAANLQRLPFLGRLGGFGVDLHSRSDGQRAVTYAAGLLDAPGRLVWIFPQGRERPITEPLRFYSGAARVAEQAPSATLLAVGLRYEFGAGEKPVLHASIGHVDGGETRRPRASSAVGRDAIASTVARQQSAVARELTIIDAALCSGEWSEFETVLRSPVPWSARLAERALAVLTRNSARHTTPGRELGRATEQEA